MVHYYSDGDFAFRFRKFALLSSFLAEFCIGILADSCNFSLETLLLEHIFLFLFSIFSLSFHALGFRSLSLSLFHFPDFSLSGLWVFPFSSISGICTAISLSMHLDFSLSSSRFLLPGLWVYPFSSISGS